MLFSIDIWEWKAHYPVVLFPVISLAKSRVLGRHVMYVIIVYVIIPRDLFKTFGNMINTFPSIVKHVNTKLFFHIAEWRYCFALWQIEFFYL